MALTASDGEQSLSRPEITPDDFRGLNSMPAIKNGAKIARHERTIRKPARIGKRLLATNQSNQTWKRRNCQSQRASLCRRQPGAHPKDPEEVQSDGCRMTAHHQDPADQITGPARTIGCNVPPTLRIKRPAANIKRPQMMIRKPRTRGGRSTWIDRQHFRRLKLLQRRVTPFATSYISPVNKSTVRTFLTRHGEASVFEMRSSRRLRLRLTSIGTSC